MFFLYFASFYSSFQMMIFLQLRILTSRKFHEDQLILNNFEQQPFVYFVFIVHRYHYYFYLLLWRVRFWGNACKKKSLRNITIFRICIIHVLATFTGLLVITILCLIRQYIISRCFVRGCFVGEPTVMDL